MTPKPTYEDLERKVTLLDAELRKFKQKADDTSLDIAERKRLERELSHMHELMHYVIWRANSAIAIHDRDMKYIYVSENYLKQYKVKDRDVIGKHHYDVFPDLPQKWRDVHQRVLAGAVEGNNEDTYIRADGSVDWTRWTCRPWYESDGSIGGIIVDTEVITDRKRAEDALRRSEENYRQLFDNAPTAIYQIDFQTKKFLKGNDVVCEYCGCTHEEITSLSPYDLLTDNSKRLFLERCGKMELGEEVPEFPEYEIVDKNGKHRWVQLNSKNIYSEDGAIIGADVIAHEITERKVAEDALRESEEQFRAMFELASIGVGQSDPQTRRLLRVNRKLCDITGYSSEELLSKGDPDFIHPDDRDMEREQFEKLLNGEIPNYGIEKRYIRKDGKIVWVNVNATIIRDDKGRPVRTMATIEDITNRKQIEQERREMEVRIQRSEKMESLGLLAGGVAHDLNNALGILVGYSELLYDGLKEGDPLREDARNIVAGGEQAAAIVQDLLTLARRGVQTKTVLRLNRIVTEYLKSPEYAKLTSFHHHIRIRTELEEDLLQISGSSIHLSKTLMNLVSNAAEAMPEGGEILIRTGNRYLDRPVFGYDELQEGDYVVLTVSDEGEGIRDDDMKRIFEPFYTKKVMGRSGTGLGLSVVWGTVKDHDGYIDVESSKGKGTTFHLYFPVTQDKEADRDSVISTDAYMGRGERILVVDDIGHQRDLARRILENLNYVVHTVSSGKDAVEYLKSHDADLVVLDMIMDPGIDGFETYRRITEIRSHQKAIIVSGFAETERVRMAQALGAGAFVRKPYIRERIGVAVRKELDGR